MPAFLQYHSPFVGERYFAFMLQWNRRTNRETATTSEQQQQTQKGNMTDENLITKCHQSNPDKTRGRFWWSMRSCKKRTTNYKPWVQGLYFFWTTNVVSKGFWFFADVSLVELFKTRFVFVVCMSARDGLKGVYWSMPGTIFNMYSRQT